MQTGIANIVKNNVKFTKIIRELSHDPVILFLDKYMKEAKTASVKK